MQKLRFQIFLTSSLSLITSFLASQNLVNNPSFETYTTCPSGLNSGSPDQVKKTVNWYTIRDTPDYFNSCATSTDVLVPKNVVGYQGAATGNAYVGFIAYDKLGFGREILAQQLSITLSIGQTYYVSLKLCLAEFSTSVSEYMPCDKIGIRFSTVKSTTTTPPPINNFAHVYSNAIISDTMNWTILSGSFIADSLYQYLMLGNFFDDLNTDTLSNPPYGHRSYFFVDDICVSTNSITCPVSTNIQENIIGVEDFKIFPNPSNAYISILDSKNKKTKIIMRNLNGNEVYSNEFIGFIKVNSSDFVNGIYFIQLKTESSVLTKKIIINHN